MEEQKRMNSATARFIISCASREKSAAARYLKGMICEIQVRNVLQDAWAIIDHHLS